MDSFLEEIPGAVSFLYSGSKFPEETRKEGLSVLKT
jgi:hypothetical protein